MGACGNLTRGGVFSRSPHTLPPEGRGGSPCPSPQGAGSGEQRSAPRGHIARSHLRVLGVEKAQLQLEAEVVLESDRLRHPRGPQSDRQVRGLNLHTPLASSTFSERHLWDFTLNSGIAVKVTCSDAGLPRQADGPRGCSLGCSPAGREPASPRHPRSPAGVLSGGKGV